MQKVVVAVIQGRMGSTRLPGKTMMNLQGHPVLWHVINRVRRARLIDDIIVVTTNFPEDDIIESFCKEQGVGVFRGDSGPLNDVLSLFHHAIFEYASRPKTGKYVNRVVRITADCPLIDPEIINLVVKESYGYEYTANTINPTYPDGMDVEVFTWDTLMRTHMLARKVSDREHVTPFMKKNYYCKNIENCVDLSDMRVTLDTKEDYLVISAICDALFGRHEVFGMNETVPFLLKNPDLMCLNRMYERNEKLKKQIREGI